MKDKSLLIIGGTGFLGQSILKYLLNDNTKKNKIRKIIILSRNKLKKDNFFKILKKKFKVVKINKNILKLKKLPYADYVIYASLLNNYNHDYKAIQHYSILAKKYHQDSKIIYLSSGAVYGKQPNSIKKVKEEYLDNNKIIRFTNSYKKEYSIIKLKSEKIFKRLRRYGLKISIARCFTFVGEFLPKNSNYIIKDIIHNILVKKDILIKSDYKIIRSYMHTDDLVIWLLKILEKSNVQCPVYNVGSDDYVDVRKLAFMLGKKYKVNVLSNKINKIFVDSYVPNINKAKKYLNLKIKYNSFQAVSDIINKLKKNE
jgi:nucleoside-diphosphate-sugar epimerase